MSLDIMIEFVQEATLYKDMSERYTDHYAFSSFPECIVCDRCNDEKIDLHESGWYGAAIGGSDYDMCYGCYTKCKDNGVSLPLSEEIKKPMLDMLHINGSLIRIPRDSN
jgi:hypothetical protein